MRPRRRVCRTNVLRAAFVVVRERYGASFSGRVRGSHGKRAKTLWFRTALATEGGAAGRLKARRREHSKKMDERRRLREEQDQEYAECLAVDSRRSAAREAAAAAEAAAARQADEARESDAAAAKAERAAALAKLPAEPPESDATLTLLFRLPCGKALRRRFRKDEAVDALYNFVDAAMWAADVRPPQYTIISSARRGLADRSLRVDCAVADRDALLLRVG